MKDKEFDVVASNAAPLNAASGSRHDTDSCHAPSVEMHPDEPGAVPPTEQFDLIATRHLAERGDVEAMNTLTHYLGPDHPEYMDWLEPAGMGGVIGYFEGGLEGAAVGVAGSLAFPRLLAKGMTNPKFVRWLADGVKMAPSESTAALHLGRLTSIASDAPELAEDLSAFLIELRGN